MKIGFIGLGNMGSGMAANLLKAGHEVTAYNRSQDRVDAVAAQGARPARSVAEACGGDVVISMLANDEAVEAVTFGDGGILASLAAGASPRLIVDDQRGAVRAADRRARRRGSGLRRGSGFRASRGGRGGEAVRRRCRRAGDTSDGFAGL